MRRSEAAEIIANEINRREDYSELYHVEWDDEAGIVLLLWNSPLIERVELSYDVEGDPYD